MIIKFDKPCARGVTNAYGSCQQFVDYLCSEDENRYYQGLTCFPFFDMNGNTFNPQEVVSIIDANVDPRYRKSKPTRFYSLVYAPSISETLAIGTNEDEWVYNSLPYLNIITKEYQSMFSEQIQERIIIPMFWKPHFSRGKKDGIQFHWHAIISRYSIPDNNGNKHSCSPLTQHMIGGGRISHGFNRTKYMSTCENRFDEHFKYTRKTDESFSIMRAMARGSLEEKRAAAEEMASEIFAPYKNGIVKLGLKLHNKHEKTC